MDMLYYMLISTNMLYADFNWYLWGFLFLNNHLDILWISKLCITVPMYSKAIRWVDFYTEMWLLNDKLVGM